MHVTDVGANPVHVPPYNELLSAGACRVTGFEPQIEAYEALLKQPHANRVFVNAAVGPSGQSVLNIYRSSGFSSLFKLHPPSLRYLGRFLPQVGTAKEAEVMLRPLDEISEVSDTDLLKIDVQGAERDIISGGVASLAKAICIIPELRYYRLYADEPLLGDLDTTIRAQGFVLHKILPPVQTHIRNSQSLLPGVASYKSQWIDGDAIYIRSMEQADLWSDDQLIYLAFAADSVFDSPDLCLRALDILSARGSITRRVAALYARALVGSNEQPADGV